MNLCGNNTAAHKWAELSTTKKGNRFPRGWDEARVQRVLDYYQRQADKWDREFEADVKTGKLDALAKRALRDHKAGRTTKL